MTPSSAVYVLMLNQKDMVVIVAAVWRDKQTTARFATKPKRAPKVKWPSSPPETRR